MKRFILFAICILLAGQSVNILAQCKAPINISTYSSSTYWQAYWYGDTANNEQWQLILIKQGLNPDISSSWYANNTITNAGEGIGNFYSDTALPLNTKFNCYIRTICDSIDTSAWSAPQLLLNLAAYPVYNVIANLSEGIQINWKGTSTGYMVYRYNYQTRTETFLQFVGGGYTNYNDYSVDTVGWYSYIVVAIPSGDSAISNRIEFSPCAPSFYFENTDSVLYLFNNTLSANKFYWDFGDGNTFRTDSTNNIEHIYTKNGVYNVCLFASDTLNSCSSQLCQKVAIGKNTILLEPDFTPVADSANKLLYTFYNNTGNDTIDYYWTFGDGKFSTDIQPTGYLYAKAGNYEVCLTAKYKPTGQTATTCKKIMVGSGGCNLSADFSYIITDTALQFSDQSLGNVKYYNWYFDDGFVSTDKNPVHKFSMGEHYIRLMVTDTNWYCTDTREAYVQIGTLNCKAAFDYSISNDSLTVIFSNKSDGKIAKYYWSFGDGSFSNEENPIHHFGSQGKYYVKLVIENTDNSCMDYTENELQVGTINCSAQFSYIVNIDSMAVYCKNNSIGKSTKYYWSFGDGSFSKEADPNHKFLYPGYYTIGLNTFDSVSWCMDYYSTPVLVGTESIVCEPDFFYTVDSGRPKVKFKDNSIGKIKSYIWDFGDGIVSTDKDTTTHIYPHRGYYDVCLTLINENNVPNMTCKWIEVAPNATTNCFADFIYDIDKTSKSVSLVSKSLGKPNAFIWDLGDKNTSTQKDSLVYTYKKAGYYLVSLHISTADGCESNGYKLLNIGMPDGIIAKFGYNAREYNTKAGGYPVDLVGAGIGDNSRLKWNFGDGSDNSTSMTPSHSYNNPGKYKVCLTYVDTVSHEESTECDSVSTQTMCQNDTIKPIAKCKNITITLDNGTKDISALDVDANSTDNCKGIYDYYLDNKRFTSANEGVNIIHLTVTDFNNNSSTCSANVTVLTGVNGTSLTSAKMVVSPNPLRNFMTINYQVPVRCDIEISIYDLLGKKVTTISSIKTAEGKNILTYDASRIENGSYIIQLKTSTGIVKRQVIVKQ